MTPDLLHRLRVECGELAHVAVGSRHRHEFSDSSIAAFDRLSNDPVHARLVQRHNQQSRRLVVAHRAPILAALRARAHIDGLVVLHLVDVRAIRRRSRFRIDVLPDRLFHHLLVAKKLSRPAVELPKDSRLSGVEDDFLIADIDEHALEHLIEIEAFRAGANW